MAGAPEIWLLVLAGAAATYAWRGLGVLLSGRIEPDSELFRWVACVAYAMIAGLVARIIVMPTGALSETLLVERLAACAVALVAFYATRRNLFAGVAAGAVSLVAFNYLRLAL